MRIVTMCTLAFAICGEREGKTSKTVQPKTSTNRRGLAKGLLLGAFVPAASGFGQAPHPARALGRPAGVRPLEPLQEWGGIDTFNKIKGMFDPQQTARADRMSNRIQDALAGSERLEGFGPHVPWAEWRPKAEMYLAEKNERKLEELWLVVMEDNAKRDAEEGQELLTKIQNDQMITKDDEAKWKALEDDIRVFQYWQKEARERFLSYPTFKTEDGKRALTSLKGVMNHPVTLDTAKRVDQLLNAEKQHELLTQSAKSS